MESTETTQALAVAEPIHSASAVATLPAAAAASEAPTTDPSSDSPDDHGLTALIGALRAREFALIDPTVMYESAVEVEDAIRAWLRDFDLDTTIAGVRALVGRFDLSVFSVFASAITVAARRRTTRPRAKVPAPDASYPSRVRTIRISPAVSARPMAPRAPRLRVRWRRVVSRGMSLGLIAAVLIALPPQLIEDVASEVGPIVGNVANEAGPAVGNVANEVSSVIANVASEVSTAIGERLAAATAPTLTRATFELPPLSAYAATFESQAPYPTAHPNGTVEWVVALRNTGSVGWYRGIDGAQASLALADGTAAGVQSTEYVGPGQVGWFVVRFTAPSQPGVSTVSLHPRIDGRGTLPDLGIYATVTVSPNP